MIRNDDNQTVSQGDALAPVRSRTVSMVIPASDPMGGDSSSGRALNLDVYLHALRRTWLWCLLAGGVLATVAAGLVWWLVPDQYTAVAELRAYTLAPRLLTTGAVAPQEKYETVISNTQQMLQSRLTITTALRAVGEHPLIKRQPDQEGWVLDHLRVSNPKNSEVLLVSVTVPGDPQLAADLANAVVNAYKKEVLQKEDDAKEEKLLALRGHLSTQAEEERKQRADLESRAAALGTTDGEALSLQQQIRLTQAQQVKNELAKTQVQRMRADADRKILKDRNEHFSDVPIPEDEVGLMVAADPVGRYLMDQIAAIETGTDQAGQLSNPAGGSGSLASATIGRGRQMINELSDRLKRVRDTMSMTWQAEQRKALRNAIDEKEAECQALADLEEKLVSIEAGYDTLFKDLGTQSYQLAIKTEDIRRLSSVMDNLSREIEFATIEKDSGARVEIRAPALVPRVANKPGNVLLAIMAGMVTFLLPGIGMILLDLRLQRVNSVHEVKDRLGLPVFGSVPMLPSRATRGLDGTSKRGRRWQAVLSEAVSGIRANLLRLHDVRVVMVTSSVGGEGKTTVATQLAMSLARVGKRTALVDFDLPRPAVNNVFDLPLEPGVCDVLRSDNTLDEVVHEVPLPNLFVITSGIADASSARFMNSARLEELIQELRERFDYVIVDGSPLIPVADARVVSRYVDGAICCVLRDVSRMALIRQSADILESFKVRLLGTVVTAKQDAYYLSYGGDREEQLQTTKV